MTGVAESDLVAVGTSLAKNERGQYQCWSRLKRDSTLRQITAPSERLKEIQRQVNMLLQRLALPNAIHGSRRGRSALTNAVPHQYADILVQTDIKNFFPSVSSGRVYRMFRSEQDCSPDVARLLTRLVTFSGSLPQGAPTSPIVAALTSRDLTERLYDLSRKRGGQCTIYIDDVTISGVNQPYRVQWKMSQIIRSEGFTPHPNKSNVSFSDEERVVTGVRVGRGIDSPRELINKLKRLLVAIEKLPSDRRDIGAIRSAHGLVNHLRPMNPGSAKHYAKRLRRVEAGLL